MIFALASTNNLYPFRTCQNYALGTCVFTWAYSVNPIQTCTAWYRIGIYLHRFWNMAQMGQPILLVKNRHFDPNRKASQLKVHKNQKSSILRCSATCSTTAISLKDLENRPSRMEGVQVTEYNWIRKFYETEVDIELKLDKIQKFYRRYCSTTRKSGIFAVRKYYSWESSRDLAVHRTMQPGKP